EAPLDVLVAELPGAAHDVVEHDLVDVHGIDLPARADFLREEIGEEPRAGADVGRGHPGLQPDRLQDLLAPVEDLPSLALERTDEFLVVAPFEEALVDPRRDALVL